MIHRFYCVCLLLLKLSSPATLPMPATYVSIVVRNIDSKSKSQVRKRSTAPVEELGMILTYFYDAMYRL